MRARRRRAALRAHAGVGDTAGVRVRPAPARHRGLGSAGRLDLLHGDVSRLGADASRLARVGPGSVSHATLHSLLLPLLGACRRQMQPLCPLVLTTELQKCRIGAMMAHHPPHCRLGAGPALRGRRSLRHAQRQAPEQVLAVVSRQVAGFVPDLVRGSPWRGPHTRRSQLDSAPPSAALSCSPLLLTALAASLCTPRTPRTPPRDARLSPLLSARLARRSCCGAVHHHSGVHGGSAGYPERSVPPCRHAASPSRVLTRRHSRQRRQHGHLRCPQLLYSLFRLRSFQHTCVFSAWSECVSLRPLTLCTQLWPRPR
jgi:hypothetical protein